MLHAAATVLMIGSAIAAAACCLGAGRLAPREVPWQARQSAVVMALGMVALCAGGGDARVLLLIAVAGIGSAMLGVVGTRGRAHADACFHRALGGVVMAVCALAMLGAGAGAGATVGARAVVAAAGSASGHAGHGALVPLSVVAAAGVAALLGLMLVARVRHGAVHGRAIPARTVPGRTVPGRTVPARTIPARADAPGVPAGSPRGGALSGRILLEAEGIAMAVSLAVMGAMVLMP